MIRYHDVVFSKKKGKFRKKINLIGAEKISYLFLLMRADKLAQSMYMREEKMAALEESERMFTEIMEAGECVNLKMLAVNGGDLIANGFPKGRQMGEILQNLLEIVLEDPEKNTKEHLLELAKDRYGSILSVKE